MKKGIQIKIEKLSPVHNPAAPTPDRKGYVAGQDNGPVSLPIDYWAIGVLENDVELDKPLVMMRTNRNGVMTPGLFHTSYVKRIEGNLLHTENSIYRVTPITETN
jgi:hypothetical protein